MDGIPSEYRVVPFGNPRIKGYLHLPAAYRSLSRPSSPPRAKASAMRPFLLSFTVALRLDIYFQRFDFYLLFVHHVIERFPYLSKEMWRITDSNR